MRILIAEDDHVSRRLLKAKLKKWNYEVVAVSDGEAAWKALQNDDAPQLAILDWMMPERDGIDVCRAVRARSSGPYIYQILLTSKNCKNDIIEGLEAGADDYLIKPFDAFELQARLNRI